MIGGTTEGRELAGFLSDSGYKVTVSTATEFCRSANKIGPVNEISTRSGALSRPEMIDLIKSRNIGAVIDATHPFAVEISKLARSVCEQLDWPYLRFERAQTNTPIHPDVIPVSSFAAAAAAQLDGNVFLATGVKSIEGFAAAVPKERLFARVLPWPQSLNQALKWLPPENIIAALGPFTAEFNKACFRLFQADTLVTKNSGAGAGIEEKISAALELKMKVVIIDRPQAADDSLGDFAAVAGRLEGLANVRV